MNIRFLIPFFSLLLFSNSNCWAGKDISVDLDTYTPWSEEALSTFEKIMIQEGGRVKPIHTFSRFTLMRFMGGGTRLKFETEDGETHKVNAPAWLMDCLFRPEISRHLPCFLIEDSTAVVQIGVSPKSKRDKYSYHELLPGRAKLNELGQEYSQKAEQHEKDSKKPDLTTDEKIILRLARNINGFEYLMTQFAFSYRDEERINQSIIPEPLKSLARNVKLSEMLGIFPELGKQELFRMLSAPRGETEEEQLLASAANFYFFSANSASSLHILPPEDNTEEKWVSLGEAMFAGLESKEQRPWVTEQMEHIESLMGASEKLRKDPDQSPLIDALQNYVDMQHKRASGRGEGAQVEREVAFYGANYFLWSKILFILSLVTLSISWFSPGSTFGKVMQRITIALVLIACGILIWGIAQRCIIRSRPPITNLYDTTLFITAVAVLLGLALERFTRIGVGLLVSVASGFLGMWLGIAYEAKESTDTMGKLLAVLDTNFWLWTHVTIVSIGYAAGLVAAFLGAIYLVTRFFTQIIGKDRDKHWRDFFKTLSRMTYGTVCFCLFFSLVGTVLGGIWANYSWGRFWGWDPKENGALMICLWSLVILHARMGGYIRDIGICMNAIILGVIVSFSWWGVNNLEVGLHSYGFTAGIERALHISWSIMAVPFILGILIKIGELGNKSGGSPPEAAKA